MWYNLVAIGYITTSILFILALGGLSNQKTAKMGNLFGMIGMGIALIATFGDTINFTGYGMFAIMIVPGAITGIVLAAKIAMVSMPQLVAMLHSFVGLAAVLVGIANYLSHEKFETYAEAVIHRVEIFLGILIGAVTWTGSLVAFGKLQGILSSAPLIIGGWFRHVINLVDLVGCFALYGGFEYLLKDEDPNNFNTAFWLLLAMTAFALFLGWHLVMAIGGADMPVVVSMLNSYSGWATAAAGFMLNNDALIVSGALVGSSGAILSHIMCVGMNRNFFAVIMGGFGGAEGQAPAKKEGHLLAEQEVHEHTPIDTKGAFDLIAKAKNIVIVPGFGLAVARAQHICGELVKELRSVGKNVRFAIHPVAGRLPGHMNVLLAEAKVPYDIVLEMDEINPDLPETDLSIVLGANDVVNPDSARPDSPIAGMPIIKVYESKHCIVVKRSLATGYANIDNPLFYYENTRMLFGDAKKVLDDLMSECKKGNMAQHEGAGKKGKDLVQVEAKEEEEEADQPIYTTIGVPKEVAQGCDSVAVTPDAAKRLHKMGFGVIIESGAGDRATYPDDLYRKVGCKVVEKTEDVYKDSDIILKVEPPVEDHPVLHRPESDLFAQDQTLISFFYPQKKAELMDVLCKKGVSVLAMDKVPRISKAQKLDALSSMSNLAGYRAVIEASHHFGRLFTGQITAAGKIPPAKVLIIGCGVAGLAAIGVANNLGAIVRAFDTRKVVAEQVVSMGGEFLYVDIDEDAQGADGYAKQISAAFIKAEMELFAKQCKECDIVIPSAAIPNKPAPKLITKEMVESMKPGSVIVDLAALTGGNCEITKPGEVIKYNNVTIVGSLDLVSKMAPTASQLYANNLCNLLEEMGGGKDFDIDPNNEIVEQMLICHKNTITYPPKHAIKVASTQAVTVAKIKPPVKLQKQEGVSWVTKLVTLGAVGAVLFVLGVVVPTNFLSHFMAFCLAIIIGYQVIWAVTPALHTPLMSVTNAISGIIVVGGMLELRGFDEITATNILGAIATCLATINICGGFFVTQRMLGMFRDEEESKADDKKEPKAHGSK